MTASSDMAAFALVAERGSLARAAPELGMTASALSKQLTRLEERLGVRLLNRTTRRLSVTPEGERFLARCRDVLALIEQAEEEASAAQRTPRGVLRVTAGTAFAKHRLAPIMTDYLALYPDITIELTVTDRQVDLAAENIDIAFRTGLLADSSLAARRIHAGRRVICCAPLYLERYGTPQTPQELLHHNCLTFGRTPIYSEWPFSGADGVNRLRITGNLTADNGDLLYDLAVAGLGIVRLSTFIVQPALDDGRLVELFADSNLSDSIPTWALMLPGKNRALRIQSFVDFVAKNLDWLARAGGRDLLQPLI
ncbi:MAG: LysR family transcriptional regulator [Beijerinckiaceae bacterium]